MRRTGKFAEPAQHKAAWVPATPDGAKKVADGKEAEMMVVPVDGICRRLDSLPEEDAKVHVFAALLSANVRKMDLISPYGFVLATNIIAFELASGACGCAGEAMSAGLVGLAPREFNAIVEKVAEAACPPDFAAQVCALRMPFASIGEGNADASG